MATTLYVGSDQTYTTIQAALDAAVDGDTIIVSAGDYTGQGEIVIKTGVTLKAADGAEVIVDHVVLGAQQSSTLGSVTVSGLTMKPTFCNGGDWNYSGVWQNAYTIDSVTIENCVIDLTAAPTNNSSMGIKMSRSYLGDNVGAVTITGNTIIAGANTEYAFKLADKKTITSINISENTVTGSYTSSAMNVDLGHNTATEYKVNISGNTIDIDKGIGIFFGGINNAAGDIAISGNDITSENGTAIGFYSATCKQVDTLAITSNTITSTGSGVNLSGIVLEGADVNVSENKIAVSDTSKGIVGFTPAAEANNTVSAIEVITGTATILVNSSWADMAVGTQVLTQGDYYIIGTNAFATLSEAMDHATIKTEKLVIETDVAEDSFSSLGGFTIETTVSGGVTINNTYDDWVYVSGDTKIGSGVTINSSYYFYYGENNSISGKLIASGQNYQGYDDVITVNPGGYIACNGEAFVIRYNTENGSAGGFKLIGDAAQGAALENRTAQMSANYYSFYSGTIDAKDTLITGGPIWMTNTTDGTGKAVALLDNTIWTSSANLVMTGNASITLTNGSMLSVATFEGGAGSSLDATSKLTIQDSAFIATQLANNGTITVSGASTVKIATVTGNGIILDSATLTADSNIGGSAVTKIYGTSTIKGTVGTVHANWAGAKVDGKYAGYTTGAVALTLDGATTGNVYVGSDTEGYAAALTVNGNSNVGGIYSRVYGTTTITGSDNFIKYINAKGSVIVDDAVATIESMVAEGADIEITDSTVGFAIGTSNCIQLDEGTTMTVTGSDIDVQQMSIDATSALVLNNSTINVDDVYNEGDIITNNGSITISGESTVKLEKIDGSGWVYMAGATIDEETNLKGAKVRFASGTNNLNGAILNNVSYFQVGQGSKFGGEAVDTNIDSANGVIVNATNGAQIGSNGNDYTGWIGSQFNSEVGTAKYTLNMTDSTGYFGYLHIYKDGFLNFTNTENVTTTFHGGTFIVNNKANFTGGQLDFIYTTVNSNATLTINGSDVLFNHTNSADRASVTVYGSLKITDSTVALGKKMVIDADGQVTLSNTDVSIYNGASTIVNNGTFNVEQGSTITVGSFTNNGTINFTAGSDYKGGLLINDTDGAGSDYGTVNITVEGQSGFEAVEIYGDLYAVNKNAIYVDYSWATTTKVGTYLGEGMYYGINAFSSLESIDTTLTEGPCTVYFDYAATTVAGLVITVNGQSTITNYTFDDVSYNVLNGKQREHDIKLVWNEEKSQYEFSGAFNFSSGDFSFKEIETIVKNSNTSTAVTPDAGITEKVQIGGVSGDKSYTFSLTAISDFKYTISGLEGAGRLTLTNKAGEVVATRLFGSNGTYVLSELGQGDYKATFEGYGYRNDEAEFTVQFEFDRIEVEVLNDERANATAVNFAETQEIENAIGSGDGVDWFAITGMAPAADGTLVMDFDVEGQGKGSQILVNVYKVTGGKSQTIGGFVVNDTDALGEYDLRKTFYGVSAGDTIYVQVFGYGESEYTINLAQPTSL